MKFKKVIAIIAVASMIMGMTAGCGSNDASQATDAAPAEKTEEAVQDVATEEEQTATEAETTGEATTDLAGTEISFLNSKGEIQAALEEMAVTFEEETGISVEIIACGAGESPYTKITSAYNSGTAPTMAMLDTTDVVALAKE